MRGSLEHRQSDVKSSPQIITPAPEHADYLTFPTVYLFSGEESSESDTKLWGELCGCWGGPFRDTAPLSHSCFYKLPVTHVPVRNSTALIGSPRWTSGPFYISHQHIIWDLQGFARVFPGGHTRDFDSFPFLAVMTTRMQICFQVWIHSCWDIHVPTYTPAV